MNVLQSCRIFSVNGEVAERLKATVSKTVKPLLGLQGFESLPLRQDPATSVRRNWEGEVRTVEFNWECR
jgi:hypothetical protein